MSYANWNPTAFYLTNDLVYDGNEDYIALANNFNKLPSANPAIWSVIAPPGPPTGLANVVTADGSGIISVVAGNTATLSSALVNDPNITLTPAVSPSKDLTIGVNSALTSISSINGTELSDYGFVSIAHPATSTTISTASTLSPTSILSLTFVDANPSFVPPSNQLLWYSLVGPNTLQINSSASAPLPGDSLVIAWRLLVA